jgi:hypothetical protein
MMDKVQKYNSFEMNSICHLYIPFGKYVKIFVLCYSGRLLSLSIMLCLNGVVEMGMGLGF